MSEFEKVESLDVEETTEKGPERPEINVFGKEIDEAIFEYAEAYKNHMDIFSNKDRYATRKDWSDVCAEADKRRRFYHEQAAKKLLKSDLFSPDVYMLHEFSSDKDKMTDAMGFLKKTREVYSKIIDISQDSNVTDKNENRALSSQEIEILIADLKLKGFKLFHDPNELTNNNIVPVQAGDRECLFSEKVDKAILDYEEKNINLATTAHRYAMADESRKEKFFEYFRDADTEKNAAHKRLVMTLSHEQFLPKFDSEYITDKWEDKGHNPIRRLAEKYADLYLNVAHKLIKK